jgi:hypothetical protein
MPSHGGLGLDESHQHTTLLLSKSIMISSVSITLLESPRDYFFPSSPRVWLTLLEQEYDAQADMVDDDQDGSIHSSFVPGFTPQSVASGSHSLTGFNPPSGGESSAGDFGNANHLLGQYEPMLDNDPFGLSASMHFPTPFNYEQNHPRS